jgi:hypothetical protein
MAADSSMALVSGALITVIKQLRGIFDNQQVPGTIIFFLNLVKAFIEKSLKDDNKMKVHIMEAINFITGSGKETEAFLNSPFTYL